MLVLGRFPTDLWGTVPKAVWGWICFRRNYLLRISWGRGTRTFDPRFAARSGSAWPRCGYKPL